MEARASSLVFVAAWIRLINASDHARRGLNASGLACDVPPCGGYSQSVRALPLSSTVTVLPTVMEAAKASASDGQRESLS